MGVNDVCKDLILGLYNKVLKIGTTCHHDDVRKWTRFPPHWPFVKETTSDHQRWIPLTQKACNASSGERKLASFN